MTLPEPPLIHLAHAHRVATSFTDWRGVTQTVSAETLTAVLGALGVDTTDPEAALRAEWDAPWRRTLPACTTAVQGTERLVWMHVPDGAPAALAVELETGGRRELAQVDQWVAPRTVDGAAIGEATFQVPGDLPLGYHRLVASSGGVVAEAPLIVAPAQVGLPARMGDRRGWGLAAQLYSVRSAGSWGVGDLTDLTDLGVWAGAELGADYVLVNPLHAAEPVPPMEPSPYLPSSRRFFNPLYLRVEAVPEHADLPSRARARLTVLARRVRERSSGDRIDRDAAWTAKREALRLLFAVPRSAGRELDLAAFRRREGDALTGFATWSVLAEEHGNDARAWPEELRDPASPAVAAFAADHAAEIDFTCWLQWLLDEQLARAQDKALSTGMGIGVMHDLAVGVHPGGADAWRLGDAYARGVAVGAPPDPFNQLGQNWLQPPWRPDALEASAYAPFRDLIRAVLRHAGGVRVDHVIGLFRLWWVPEGRDASEGAYVYYDHEALIGVLALEAVRAQAVVVGEDLGVVDPSAREVPGLPRDPRHLDPVVRDRGRGRAARGALARAVPRLRDDPRPAADGRVPRGRARAPPQRARPAHPARGGGARGRPGRAARVARRGPPARAPPARRRRGPRPRCGPGGGDRPRAPPLPGADPGAAGRRGAGRPRRRPADAEPAGHDRRVPELARAAVRPGRRAPPARGRAHLRPRRPPRGGAPPPLIRGGIRRHGRVPAPASSEPARFRREAGGGRRVSRRR